jgi:hypothetical protein
MARKIKVLIETPEKNIKLPGVGVKTAVRFIRFGLWGTKFFKDSDEDFQQLIKDNKEQIIDFLYAIADDLENLEPFTLVEVKSSDSYILINII